MPDNVVPGDILILSFPVHLPGGHEQEGIRPAIVVSVPEKARYPVIIVVPLTTQDGPWVDNNPALYVRIPSGSGGLSQDSVALLDQIRAVDVRRVKSFIGRIEHNLLEEIIEKIIAFFSV